MNEKVKRLFGKAFLKNVISIPSVTYREERMRDFILAFAKKRAIAADTDKIGNVCIVKEASAGKESFEEVRGYLSEARQLTGQGIKELRESINMLRQEAEYELVTQGVMQLANQMKEIPVEVTVRGEDSGRYSHLSKTVYDTVRESMTNTLKYGEAKKMDVIIRFHANSLELVIADDGKGCGEIRDNNGLRGIRERVQKAGGKVTFSSSPGEGFLTRVKIPV